ncbi:MAG: DUF1553 domain-containing protein [Lentisphaerae bacterium]|nr:DUF1553 domain-containing protein [Lentisphaerota bacterium]
MKLLKIFSAAVLLCTCFAGYASQVDELDRLLKENYKAASLAPVKRAGDDIFLRRVMINVTGKVPTIAEVRAFTADKAKDKRSKLIAKLLDSPGYADMMAMRFADMFRIKSEFPINLWPNAVQSYHRYFRDAAVQNRPWNKVARELLTASGSNFRVPAANFFRASSVRTAEGLAKVTALSFLGINTDKLSADERKDFAAFFSRISFKSTDEWKEEIVFLNPDPVLLTAVTPDGKSFEINSPAVDPRVVFADWLLEKDNPFFARAFVNRAWHWIFGKGLIDPADDMPLPKGFFGKLFSSESGNEKVLNFLASEFTRSNYDIKKLFCLILNSCAYSADWKTLPSEQTEAEKCFAVYPFRRLEAEVLVDIYSQILGAHESYSSVIPEPFTFLPKGSPAVTIADGSISSRTLDNFGKPSRDSGVLAERNNNISASQRLFLMNSNWIYQRTGSLPWKIFKKRRMNDYLRTEELYLTILSRKPTAAEIKKIDKYRKKLDRKSRWRVWSDLAWALINTREFLHHH